MQVCTSLQTDNHASTEHSFFMGRMPFLPPNQQRQSTEGTKSLFQYFWLVTMLQKMKKMSFCGGPCSAKHVEHS